MNHDIIVTVNSDGSYDYNHNGMHGCKQHVKAGETIRWKSAQGDITVSFDKDGNPTTGSATYNALQGSFTPKATLAGDPGESFDYTVAVQGFGSDDPQIIFDDGGLPPNVLDEKSASDEGSASDEEFASEEEFVADAVPTIRAVWSDVLTELNAQAAGDKFFPFGITNIAISVNLATTSFSLTVTGPTTKP